MLSQVLTSLHNLLKKVFAATFNSISCLRLFFCALVIKKKVTIIEPLDPKILFFFLPLKSDLVKCGVEISCCLLKMCWKSQRLLKLLRKFISKIFNVRLKLENLYDLKELNNDVITALKGLMRFQIQEITATNHSSNQYEPGYSTYEQPIDSIVKDFFLLSAWTTMHCP